MNQKQALTAAVRILGRRAGIKHQPEAPDSTERAALAEQLPDHSKRLADSKAALAACLAELLKDSEYQRLNQEARTARETHDACTGKLHYYRCKVGTVGTMFFTVEAEGDTWEETLAALAKKKGISA